MSQEQDWEQMREGIIGLGSASSRRSFYPELRARMAELERTQEELRQSEENLKQLNRKLRALSDCNQILVRAEDETSLLQAICRTVCAEAGYCLAWAGFGTVAEGLRPVAWAGQDGGYLEQVGARIAQAGRMPLNGQRALEDGQAAVIQDVRTLPEDDLVKHVALQHGFLSMLALPLKVPDRSPFGLICIYADQPGVFSPEEVELLEELAEDLAFGITVLRARRERERMEEALRERESQLEGMLQAIPDLLFTYSRDGEYLSIHAADSTRLVVPAEDLLGRRLEEVLPAPVAAQWRRAIAAALASRQVQQLEYHLEVGAGPRTFEARVAPYAPDAAIALVRDITEQRQMADQQRALESQLLQTQKMESLGNLAGGIAHDMNNVLGAIMALASAHLRVQPADSAVGLAFERIVQAASRGSKMMRSLLSFARPTPAEIKYVDLNALIQEQAQLLEHTTLARVRLKLELEPDLRCLEGDIGALGNALMNLCINAVDAMPDGGTLALRTRNLDQGRVEVLVADTGTGMSEEVRARALEPFFTTKPQGKGTGLGLAMVYSAVKAHQGALEIESRAGEGTQVRMCFPVRSARAGGPEPRAAAAEPGTAAARTILLVDDDELVRESVQILLEALGHKVKPAASGEACLDLLESGLQPDLVLLDLNMPGLDGGKTLQRLRLLRPELVVVITTGRVDQDALELTRAYPNVFLLAKPFGLPELRRFLGQLG
jgi:signal transduction histidine kinase/putative methionine-R-sulfoxide reductase with GAF domain